MTLNLITIEQGNEGGGFREKGNQWLDQFKNGLIEHGLGSDVHVERLLDEQDGLRRKANQQPFGIPVSAILWYGCPFVLIGTQQWIIDRLRAIACLTPDGLPHPVFLDYAYFWAVSTEPRSPAQSDGPVWAPTSRPVFLSASGAAQDYIRKELRLLTRFQGLLGLSRAMRQLRAKCVEILEALPKKDGKHEGTLVSNCVLVVGESGSGKSEIAKVLGANRQNSAGKPGRAGMVDCGGIPETLLQSELFGHKKGGATSLIADRPGLLCEYAGHTLILNDLDAAPPSFQAALLGYLDTGLVRPVGGDHAGVAADTWLVFTTNANVRKAIADQRFRPDFVYRCEERVLVVPRLATRPADIPAFARAVWSSRQRARSPELPKLRDLTWAPIKWLCDSRHQWPGNLRTLRAFLSLSGSMSLGAEWATSPLIDIFQSIMRLGNTPLDWVGIVETPEVIQPPGDSGTRPSRGLTEREIALTQRVVEEIPDSFDDEAIKSRLEACGMTDDGVIRVKDSLKNIGVKSLMSTNAQKAEPILYNNHFRLAARCILFAKRNENIATKHARGLKVSKAGKIAKTLLDALAAESLLKPLTSGYEIVVDHWK